MTRRVAAVLARPPRAGAAPPGVDPVRYADAMLADVFELLDDMALVDTMVAACPASHAAAAEAVTHVPVRAVDLPAPELAVLDTLAAEQVDEAAIVAPDAPDLPPLLVAKLFSGLTRAEAAVCPAEHGGLVALACRLPVPSWLRATAVGLDQPDALAVVTAAAPTRGALVVGPGWRRLRGPADVARLDPGLEGWQATRALLSGSRP